MVSTNPQEALDFLSHWAPEGPWHLCAFHGDNTDDMSSGSFVPGSPDRLAEWLTAQSRCERNCYFHVNTVRPPKRGKASKMDVRRVDALHVDVDPVRGKPIESERDRILELLQDNDALGLVKPSVIIFSGGGYQAFWRLDTPIEVGGDINKIHDVEDYNVQITNLMQADACHNADRIMRLPGTVNYPKKAKRVNGQKPMVATVVSADWDASYSLDLFLKPPTRASSALNSSPNQVKVVVNTGNVQRIAADALTTDAIFAGVSARAKCAIVQGSDPDQLLSGGDQSGSAWLWYVTCELARAKVDDDTIYSIITDPDLGISAHILSQGNATAQHRAAVRTIQRAREHAIDPRLEEVNREYAVVESVGGKFRIARMMHSAATDQAEVEFHLRDGFLAMWGNKFVDMPKYNAKGECVGTVPVPVGKWWLEHPQRREYREVVFYPDHNFPTALNLWRGFACEAVPGDCSLYLEHVRGILCKGNERHYEYLLSWMASAVQFPYKPGGVAVVLRGGQGTGKGTFCNIFGHIFGGHYKYVNNPEHITGRFNSMLQDAALVFADECFASRNKTAEGSLKTLITEPKVRVEAKGIENIEVRNCTHLMMATNQDWAITADKDDRRFFVLELAGMRQMDAPYFAAIRKQMADGGYEALLHMLMSRDLSDFDASACCPKTAELREQQDHSMDEMSVFMLHALEEGRQMPACSSWRESVLKEALVEQFNADYPRYPKNVNRAMGIFLAKFGVASGTASAGETWIDSSGRQRQSSARPKIWTFPPLDECRKLWENTTNMGARDWPEAIDEEEEEDAF